MGFAVIRARLVPMMAGDGTMDMEIDVGCD
jgi:hypothetical protein